MSDKNIFTDRERALEGAYFQKRDQELVEKLRRRAALEAERRQIAEELGNIDEELIDGLQQLGFTRENLKLLHLVPLVQMAWSEGKVTPRERELIYEIAQSRGITPGAPTYQQLNEWLDRRPPQQFFENALTAIYILNQTLPKEEQAITTEDLLAYCTRIAEASGGVLGFGNKVSEEERKQLEQIIAELTRNNPDKE
jgi:hypothetical protein